MQLFEHAFAHLTYCLNVHPGESLAEVLTAIRTHAVPIRDLVASRFEHPAREDARPPDSTTEGRAARTGRDFKPKPAFGLGLRIANAASLELEADGRLAELKALLDANHLYTFTINGFPFGAFHGARVKEQVYRPDWRSEERRGYTCRLARQLAGLLPTGLSGSISTVPGSHKAWIRTEGDVAAMVEQLAETAVYLARLQTETGQEIHLGLEPEPDCYLETTSETITFFQEHLVLKGREHVAARLGCSLAAAEDVIWRHIGVCFDTCHLALQFEDLTTSLRQFAGAGIRLSKIQLSAAIQTQWTPGVADELRKFCDSVYLHQVKTCVDGKPVSRGDLVDAMGSNFAPKGEEWRVHCHVPLYFVQDGSLTSTADQMTPAFFRAALELQIQHFEIETYTFNVLPAELQQRGVDRSIADEYGWVQSRFL